MAARSLIIRSGVALAAAAGLLVAGETALRLLDRPFSPSAFLAWNAPSTAAEGLASAPTFDPVLFWRRSSGVAPARDPNEYLLIVLGDEAAVRPPGGRRAWPELLDHLVGLNETSHPLRVLNAAEPGYSSVQGLRRFEQLAALRPDAACFAFGRNDARPARIPDSEYGRRLAALGPSSRSWLALRAAHAAWGWRAPDAVGPRVGASEYRSHAAAFVERARASGSTPILILGGPADYDAAIESVGASAGAAVLSGEGVRLAESLLDLLAGEGIVTTQRRRAAEIELDGSHDEGPELEGGWLPVETASDGVGGRRLTNQASLTLETLAGETGAALDVTCPDGFAGRVQVDGGASRDLSGCRGREWRRIPLGARGRIHIRFFDEGAAGAGLVVHGVRLVPSDADARVAGEPRLAAEIDLAVAGDERPELGPGFWARETWSDGRQGRWTAREASLRLARRDAERALVLDVTLQRPDNLTSCRIEANGVPVYEFRTRNGRHRFGIDIQRVPGRVVHVRLVADRTFMPEQGDPRALGVFLHSARLAASEVP